MTLTLEEIFEIGSLEETAAPSEAEDALRTIMEKVDGFISEDSLRMIFDTCRDVVISVAMIEGLMRGFMEARRNDADDDWELRKVS